MRGRDRGATYRLVALGGLAAGAVLALVAGSRPWWRAAGTGVSVSFSGTESTGGLAQALALVALAGALLALVLRSRGRRVLGVLLLLAGAGTVAVGLFRPRPSSVAVQSRVLQVSLADQIALVGTAWPALYAVAGLLVLAAAVLTVRTAPRWPVRSGRFERPTGAAASAAAVAAARDDDPASLWRLLDVGVDPTDPVQEVAPGDAAHTSQPSGDDGANHPPSPGTPDAHETDETDETGETTHPSERVDVHEQPSRVTMKPRAAARDDELPT